MESNKTLMHSNCKIRDFAKHNNQIITIFDKPIAAPIHMGCVKIAEKSRELPVFS